MCYHNERGNQPTYTFTRFSESFDWTHYRLAYAWITANAYRLIFDNVSHVFHVAKHRKRTIFRWLSINRILMLNSLFCPQYFIIVFCMWLCWNEFLSFIFYSWDYNAALWEMWQRRRLDSFFLLKKSISHSFHFSNTNIMHTISMTISFFSWIHFFIIISAYIVELSPKHSNHQGITVTSDEWKWHINETNEMHRNTHPINLRRGKPMESTRTHWWKGSDLSKSIIPISIHFFRFNWYEFNQLFSDSRKMGSHWNHCVWFHSERV